MPTEKEWDQMIQEEKDGLETLRQVEIWSIMDECGDCIDRDKLNELTLDELQDNRNAIIGMAQVLRLFKRERG